jgi:membrane protein YqaA with SNARE-associated domain
MAIRVFDRLLALSAQRTSMPLWLTQLGALGLFPVAIVDSSVFPVTLPGSADLLLLWLAANGGNPWLLALSAIAGSILGGYSTWTLGKHGGEGALRNYVPARLLKRIVVWIGRHPVLSVFLPAVLPPPIPLSPFVLASGALGVARSRFLLAYGAGRTLRYSLIAWLGAVYGRQVVHLWSGTLQRWSPPLLAACLALLAGSIAFGIWKISLLRKSEAAKELALRVARIRAYRPRLGRFSSRAVPPDRPPA